jgi:hypothetical protein
MDVTTMASRQLDTDSEIFPPPYTPPANSFFDEDDEDAEAAQTTNITIHAPTSIHGSHNVVTVPMIDSARIAGLLMSVMNQKITVAGGRQSNLNVQINCGMTVVGDRNVVGNVGLRTRPIVPAPTSSSTQGTPADPEAVTTSTLSREKRKPSEV